MIDAIREVVAVGIRTWDGPVIWYYIVLNLFYGLLFLFAVFETWKNWAQVSRLYLSDRFPEEGLPPVSIIIPAYNEEATIVETVTAQLDMRYPNYEIIVVNDGSDDRTFLTLREQFDLYEVPPAFPRRLETEEIRGYYRSVSAPRLLVVDKANGGKADALNAGLSASSYPLVASVDGDTIIDREALPRLVRPFLMEENVAGAGGTIRIANDCKFRNSVAVDPRVPGKYLVGLQLPEYLRAFLFGRLGWNRLGGNLLLSGAFAVFRKDLLISLGGYPKDSVTEDLDLTIAMHRALQEEGRDYSLPFVPDPVAWTQVPEDFRSLGQQRERWQRGMIRALFRNWTMLFNPRYGKIGMIAFPFFFFVEMLAPLVEMLGYGLVVGGLIFGLLDLRFAVLFFFLAMGYMLLLSIWAACLEELTYSVYPRRRDFFRILLYVFLEPFGYRQLTVWWRLKAFVRVLRKDRSWGEQARRKLVSERLTAVPDAIGPEPAPDTS